ncbi:MAG: AAA family ATPase [Firmicutes bacterium]|nr:AAA family ATPase [Bacillota bacterium]
MICFNCGYKFPSSDVKGCHLCGMKTPLKCSSCGYPNPQRANFCFNCGAQIAKPDIQSSVQNFDILPENRKNVAVIFADISGFTALSEKMDPEEVREIINQCFDYITQPVYELEGTIDKYIGDCIMVLFGARYSHSDDPRRAVMCALKMLNLLSEFSKERLSSMGLKLDISIGINYGLVVTGSIGNYFDKDYTVMGDVVNTAQRLQAAAEKGTILVSDSIYEETRDLFYYSEAREITVKNKTKPIRCYSPKNIKFNSSYDTLLVERDTELDFLLSAYNSAKETRRIVLVGEPGIGKTSLIKEFVSKLPDNVKKIWVDCNSIFQNRANYVISTLLHSIMNIKADDSSNAKKYRLISYVYYILEDYSEDEKQKNFNFLSILMGLDRENDFQNILNSMNYDDIGREILNQLVIFFNNLLKKHNIIFIIDDIHWADSSSMDIINKLTKQLSGVNTTFIFASQYCMDEQIITEEKSLHVLKLNRLSTDGIYTLSCHLLNCIHIDRSLFDSIIKFTEGNPLYIKEFIAAVKKKENYVIKEGTAYIDDAEITSLPNTIESIILANLAELDNNAVYFLQVASVVGKEFKLSWIKNILGDGSNIENMLAAPLLMNIISLKSTHAISGTIEKVYTFNQDTTREVIYSSILKKKRYEIHKRIGEFIELKYANELENYYEVLCIHFEKAGLRKKTEEYYYKTALKHKNNFNFSSALEYFNKYLEIAGVNNINNRIESNSKEVHAFINIGYIYTIIADYDRALENLNKALKIATLSDDIYTIKLMILDIYKEKGLYNDALGIISEIQTRIRPNNSIYGQLLQQKCTILRMQGDPKALQVAEESEQVLLKTKDYDNLSETMRQAAYMYYAKGDVDNSLFYLNKAYGYAERVNNLRTMAKVSRNLGIIYHSSGMVSKALEYYSKSIALSEKISDVQNLVSGNISLGILFMEKGSFNKAESLFNGVLETSRKVSLIYDFCLALLNLGDLMYERGEYADAFEKYGQSLEIAKKHSLPSEEGINYIGLVRLHLKNKSYEGITEMLEKAYKIFTDCNEISYMSDYFKYKGVYELINNNLVGALDYCEKSIYTAEQAKNDMKRLRSMRFKGIILMLMGEYENALDLYNKSINLAEQLESDYEAAKGYYRKSIVLSRLNINKEAEESLLKAKEAIRKVDQCRWTETIKKCHF